MTSVLNLTSVCTPSEAIIAREVGGEMLLIPLVSGMVDGDDALYTLSPTARAIWNCLDGKNTLQDVINLLAQTYDSPLTELQEDVLGFVGEMVDRSMIACI